MRIAIAAAILAASTGFASAEFYVLQNVQTGQCVIEQEMPISETMQILLQNKFEDRLDAEAALKDVPSCN